jgi:hypothetical protein
METASTYYTRRAREERASAIEAASAEARTAHLEIAFRLVKVATEPAHLFSQPRGHNDNGVDGLSAPLRRAFPLPKSDDFRHLLDAVDRKTRER